MKNYISTFYFIWWRDRNQNHLVYTLDNFCDFNTQIFFAQKKIQRSNIFES